MSMPQVLRVIRQALAEVPERSQWSEADWATWLAVEQAETRPLDAIDLSENLMRQSAVPGLPPIWVRLKLAAAGQAPYSTDQQVLCTVALDRIGNGQPLDLADPDIAATFELLRLSAAQTPEQATTGEVPPATLLFVGTAMVGGELTAIDEQQSILSTASVTRTRAETLGIGGYLPGHLQRALAAIGG